MRAAYGRSAMGTAKKRASGELLPDDTGGGVPGAGDPAGESGEAEAGAGAEAEAITSESMCARK